VLVVVLAGIVHVVIRELPSDPATVVTPGNDELVSAFVVGQTDQEVLADSVLVAGVVEPQVANDSPAVGYYNARNSWVENGAAARRYIRDCCKQQTKQTNSFRDELQISKYLKP